MKPLVVVSFCLSVATSFSSSQAASRWHLLSLATQKNDIGSNNHHLRERGPLALTSSGALLESEDQSSEVPAIKTKDRFWPRVLRSIRAAPFALSIVAFALGYGIGGKSSATTSSTAAKKITARNAARQYPVLAAVLLAVAIRDVWSLIPPWAKKNIPFLGQRRRNRNAAATATDRELESQQQQGSLDDLTSFAAISIKLRSLFQRGKEKFDEAGIRLENPVFVFLATIRLMDQVKQQMAHQRDDLYRYSGEEVQNPKDVLEGLDEIFEFADWAYDELPDGQTLKGNLEAKGYSLLRHEKTALPGHVAHYLAVSTERKEALISVKGTSNFEDLLTDCCGNAVRYNFGNTSFVEGGQQEISCHEGVLLSSRRLADDLFTFVDAVLLPAGYRIRVTGHSLGAGVAVIFSMILRSRIEELRKDLGDKLKVLIFASPPILDYEASRNCASFVTTYINNSDMVPRCSLSNLVLLMAFMKPVNKRLDEENLNPKDFSSLAAFTKMLSRDKHADMLLKPAEIRAAIEGPLNQFVIDDPDHLYVAGKVVHMYDEWSKENYSDRSHYENVGKSFDESKKVPTAERLYTADGTARPLRVIEIDDRMMSDHTSAGYRSSIRSLLDKPVKAVDLMNATSNQ
jgi:Lipase (class 3)